MLTYNPSNQARDGKVRRIKVELINPETNEPLRLNDDKGKPIKYKSSPRTATQRRTKWSEARFVIQS